MAVAIETMTINTADELRSINNSFQKATANYKNFNQDVSLNEIVYNEKSTKMMIDMLINNEAKTFSHLSHKKFIQNIYKQNGFLPFWFDSYGIKKKR